MPRIPIMPIIIPGMNKASAHTITQLIPTPRINELTIPTISDITVPGFVTLLSSRNETVPPGSVNLSALENRLFHTSVKSSASDFTNTSPTKAWKTEYDKLTAERKTLNQRYLALKEEVKEAEKIRKSVYSILRQEQREQQPRRKQDMER